MYTRFYMKDTRFVFVSALLFVYIQTVLFHPIGTIAIIGIFILIYGLICVVSHRLPPPLFLFLLIIFPSTMLLRSNFLVQAVLAASIIALFPYTVYILKTGTDPTVNIQNVLSAYLSIKLSYLSTLMRRSLYPKFLHKQWILPVFAGLGIASVPGFLLLGLFSSADPVFSRSVEKFFSTIHIGKFSIRIGVAILIYLFARATQLLPDPKKISFPKYVAVFNTPITILTSVIALVTGWFLAVQWRYIFASVTRETDLSQFGVSTYSEYVRRGFAELLLAGIIIHSILLVGYLSVRNRKNKLFTYHFWVQIFLIAQYGIFILSVMRRVFLYWQFHGLTLVRFYGAVFLIYLGALTIILLLRHFRRFAWARVELTLTAIMILCTGLFNADHFLSTHHPPSVNGKTDYVYLSRLSPDGYNGWMQSYMYATQTLAVLSAKPVSHFTEDDRRVFAGVGSILGSLTRSYDYLAQRHSTADQYTMYSQTVSLSLENQFYTYISTAQTDQQLLTRYGDTTSYALESFLQPYTFTSPAYTLTEQISRAESFRTILRKPQSASRLQTDPVFAHISLTDGETCAYNRDTENNTFVFCMPQFYWVTMKSTPVLSVWEKILQYNASDARVWSMLSKDIPIQTLIGLQESYISLYYKLMTLPAESRTFSRDSSTEALFLQSY